MQGRAKLRGVTSTPEERKMMCENAEPQEWERIKKNTKASQKQQISCIEEMDFELRTLNGRRLGSSFP